MNLHEDRQSAFPVDFSVVAWNRLVSDYNESWRAGGRRLLRMPPKGRKRDQVARDALSTNRDNAPVWNSPKTFNIDSQEVFWHGNHQSRIRAESGTPVVSPRFG